MPVVEGTRDPQLAADRSNVKALAQMVDNMVPKLDAIQNDMDTLHAHAQTLSTITVANIAQVQNVLRSLGSDLLILTDDTKSLATGSERILKALDAVIRHQWGPQT